MARDRGRFAESRRMIIHIVRKNVDVEDRNGEILGKSSVSSRSEIIIMLTLGVPALAAGLALTAGQQREDCDLLAEKLISCSGTEPYDLAGNLMTGDRRKVICPVFKNSCLVAAAYAAGVNPDEDLSASRSRCIYFF